MKKYCYLLSVAVHALLLLVVLYARFPITIRTGPPSVVAVRIAEPTLPLVANGIPAGAPPDGVSPTATRAIAGSRTAEGLSRGAGAGPSASRGALPFPAAGAFRLSHSVPGSFRLAPVGKSPEPWALPLGADAPPRPLRSLADAIRSGAARGGSGGGGVGPGNVFLLPFDIREKAVAEWTGSALARIERNWIIPVSGRLVFSGRVQITLTIEKDGRQQALVMDGSSVPEPLTQAALRAVQASLPLPPLPENIAGETFAFTFVFTYNG